MGNQRNNDDLFSFNFRSPFSRSILLESIPSRFKMPQVEPYDSSNDPLDHLEGYKALMMLQGTSNIFLCLAFPTTLKKAAQI